MFHVQPIESLERPELQPYLTMRRSQDHRNQGIFVAESAKVVRRLLESHFEVVSVLLPEKWLREYETLLRSRPENIQVFVAEKKVLETLTGFSMFQGVLAVGRIPAALTLSDLLERSVAPRLFVALDELANAENLGALVRNCVAFHVQGLVVGETSSSPFLRRAVRNSMGTVFELPVFETQNLVQTLGDLRSTGIRCIAAHPHAGGTTLSRADFRHDFCVVFGSEGHGISPGVLAVCDEAVAIPMPPAVDSLNVGAAAAVFLYEACRQRGQA